MAREARLSMRPETWELHFKAMLLVRRCWVQRNNRGVLQIRMWSKDLVLNFGVLQRALM
jgi:hypothetical protein